MKHHNRFWLWFISVVTFVAILFSLPRLEPSFNLFGRDISFRIGGYVIDWQIGNWRIYRDLKLQKGLDLAGGIRAVLQANMQDVAPEDRQQALESAQLVMERRVNFLGVSEPNIYTTQVGDEYRIVVELPGITDTQQALNIIGQTAQLIFKEPTEEFTDVQTAIINNQFKDTQLTGKFLKRAYVIFSQTQPAPGTGLNEPQVRLLFNDEGATLFEEVTGRNIGKPVAIYLDEVIISAPMVSEAIPGGEAIISGGFTVEQAQLLVQQLNAGALPVPVSVVEQEQIGATLGQDAVEKSIIAGIIGLALVITFMILYYGKLGIIASSALIIYGLVTLALYKLVPITLTLSGIAGFILSIGMAVDSNILVFERMKEELRSGKPFKQAMELGFGRAWNSIRDANVATLITVFVLFNPFNWNFLVTSGMVRGFALTLGLGILISLFTGIIVTRTLMRVFIFEQKSKNKTK
jgi:preprotein translocase subunit SecD